MPLRDLADLGKEVRRHQGDRQAGALGRRPQPVNGPVRRPLTLVWGREREAAAEHPRALLPRIDQGTTLGLVEREVAEDREPSPGSAW
jgi:hypothetical protein